MLRLRTESEKEPIRATALVGSFFVAGYGSRGYELTQYRRMSRSRALRRARSYKTGGRYVPLDTWRVMS